MPGHPAERSGVMFYAILALAGAFLLERRSDYGRPLAGRITALQKIWLELRAGVLKIDSIPHGSQGDDQLDLLVFTINSALARGEGIAPRLACVLEWFRRFSALREERRRLWLLLFGRYIVAALLGATCRLARHPPVAALLGKADDQTLLAVGGGMALAGLVLFIRLLAAQRLFDSSPASNEFWPAMLSLKPGRASSEAHAALAALAEREWQQGLSLTHEKARCLDERAAECYAAEKKAIARCQDLLALFELCGVGPFLLLYLLTV